MDSDNYVTQLLKTPPPKNPQELIRATLSDELIIPITLNTPKLKYTPLPKHERLKMKLTPITVYRTPNEQYSFGRKIVTNEKYLLYGLRGGLLRVFDKMHGFTVILKGHKDLLYDVTFIKDDTCSMFITCSKDRNVFVWKIGVDSKGTSLEGKVMVQLRMDEGRYFKILENGENHKVYGITNDNSIYQIDLLVLLGGGKARESVVFFKENSDFVKKIYQGKSNEGNINVIKLHFGKERNRIAVGFNDGVVKVFTLDTMNLIVAWKMINSDQINQLWWYNDSHLIVGGKNEVVYELYTIIPNEIDDSVQISLDHVLFIEDKNLLYTSCLISNDPIFLIASMKSSSVLLTKLRERMIDGSYHAFFQKNIKEFDTEIPTVSFHGMAKENEDKGIMMGLFALQTEKVQLMTYTEAYEDPKSKIVETDENEEIKRKEDEVKETKKEEEVPETKKEEEVPATEPIKKEVNVMKETKPKEKKEEVVEKKIVIKKREKVKVKKELNVKEIEKQVLEDDEGNEKPEEEVVFKKKMIKKSTPKKRSPKSKNKKTLRSIASETIDEAEKAIEDLQKNKYKVSEKPVILTKDAELEMEKRLMKKMESLVKHLYNSFENERVRRLNEEQKRQKELLTVISQTITTDIPQQINTIVKRQVNDTIKEVVPKLSKSLCKQFQSVMNDGFKKNAEKFFVKVQTNQQKTYEENLKKSVNKFVKASQNTFKQNIVPYFDNLQKQLADRTIKIVKKEINDNVTSKLKKMSNQMKDFLKQPKTRGKKTKTFSKQECLSTMKRGDYDAACQMILLSKKIDNLEWFLNQDNRPKVVVSELTMSVLLSLIQQIAAALERDSEIKFKWLLKGLMKIQPGEESISEVSKKILIEIKDNIEDIYEKTESDEAEICLHIVKGKIKNLV